MNTILSIDENILLWFQNVVRNEVLTPIMNGITYLGEFGGAFWIALCLIMLIWKRTRKVGIATAISLVMTGVISNLIIKNLVNRARPYDVIEGFDHVSYHIPSDSSFPSGHAAAAFAFCIALFLTLPMIMEVKKARLIGALFLVLAFLISLSRIYLGVHYPSDVLAGVLLGILYGIASNAIVRALFRKKSNDSGSTQT